MVGLTIYLNSLLEKLGINGDCGNAASILTVLERRHFPIGRECHNWKLQKVVLEVHNRAFAANKKKCVLVVQHTHFVWRHKLTACELIVDGIVAVPSF